MESNRLKLPIGIQTFEKLRKGNFVYIDKTKYLVDIINNINVCFLARPRRFGKSLAVSTFDAIFSGKKELFQGLYAEEFMNRADFETSPVIRLDMSRVITNSQFSIFRHTGPSNPEGCNGESAFHGLTCDRVLRSFSGRRKSPIKRFIHVFTTSISTALSPCWI